MKYALTETNRKDLIEWLRGGHVTRTVIALENLVQTPAVPICVWTAEDQGDMSDTFASTCGELWSFIDGGPLENKVRFCHGCGGKVEVKT